MQKVACPGSSFHRRPGKRQYQLSYQYDTGLIQAVNVRRPPSPVIPPRSKFTMLAENSSMSRLAVPATLSIHPDAGTAAAAVANRIGNLVRRHPKTTLGLATGRT